MSEYFRQANPYQVVTDYPIGNEVWSKFGEMNGEQIRDLQETRFLQLVKKAWSNPFYLRRWSSVGLEPGDIVNLDDITKIPTFSKSDLMERALKSSLHSVILLEKRVGQMVKGS